MSTRLIRYAVFLLAVSALPAAGQDEIGIRHQKGIDGCKSKLAAGQFPRRVAFAVCVNRVNAKAWTDARLLNRDLLEHAAAQELVAAQKFDRREMTEFEYAAARTRIKAELKTGVDQRVTNHALRQPQPMPMPMPAPSYRGPVTCMATGRMVTCY